MSDSFLSKLYKKTVNVTSKMMQKQTFDDFTTLFNYEFNGNKSNLIRLTDDSACVSLSDSVLSELNENLIIHNCLNLLGNTVANIDWYVEVDTSNKTVEVSKKLLEEANRAVQSSIKFKGLTPASFKARLVRLYALTACVPIKVQKDDLTKLFTSVELLDEHQVTILQDGKISVLNGDNSSVKPSIYNSETLDPYKKLKTYVFFIKAQSILRNDYLGSSILYSILPYVRILNNINRQIYNASKKNIAGKVLLTYDQQLGEKSRTAIANSLQNFNYYNLLSSKDINYEFLPSEFSNLQDLLKGDYYAKNIASAFGITPMLIGIGDNLAKYKDNPEEMRKSFYQETIIPKYLSHLEEVLSKHLLPMGLRLRFDIDSIPLMQEFRALGLSALDKVTSLTINEKRSIYDFPEIDSTEVKNVK